MLTTEDIEAVVRVCFLIVRYNSSAQDWLAHKKLPIKLGFAIPLNEPSKSGLPHPDENEQLDRAEDVIVREVEGGATGIYVLTLTTGTMKEFVFYIAPGADIKSIHEAVQRDVETHEVHCMAVEEPDWSSFMPFMPDSMDG